MVKDKDTSKRDQNVRASLPPFGFKVIVREVWHDKVIFALFCVIVTILLFTFVSSLFLNKDQATEINIAETYHGWGESGYIFGTGDSGRDTPKLLMMDGHNSILIGLSVIVLCEGVGLLVSLLSGYFGGVADTVITRIVDFIQILPQFSVIIILATVIPNCNAGASVLLISMLEWISTARYFRTFVLSQREHKCVLASKTFGSFNLAIIFRGVLLDITSALVIDVVLMIAGNIGIETTLSFLGYEPPTTMPSLGTLIGFVNDPVSVATRSRLQTPATFLPLAILLSVNYIGHAPQRAGNTRRRGDQI